MTRRLGSSDVLVSPLGFGSAPIGGLFRAVSDADARAAVDAAWEVGVRYFDTAPHYGVGLAERRLGSALRGHERSGFTLSTKVGRLLEPTTRAGRDLGAGFDAPADSRRVWDFSRSGVLRSVEDSLRRLGLDRVDVLLLHDPDEHYRQALTEAYPVLHELRAQGVVAAIGVGMNQWQMLAEFVDATDLDVVMLAGRYTLLDHSALTTLLPRCADRGVSVLAAGVFNSGLLAEADPQSGATYDYTAAPPQLLQRARRLAEVCRSHGTSLPAAALQFPLAHPVIAGVVTGVRSGVEMRRNAALLQDPVPADCWSELRTSGLLPETAPTPDRLVERAP